MKISQERDQQLVEHAVKELAYCMSQVISAMRGYETLKEADYHLRRANEIIDRLA